MNGSFCDSGTSSKRIHFQAQLKSISTGDEYLYVAWKGLELCD
jgi:hypothetical protein